MIINISEQPAAFTLFFPTNFLKSFLTLKIGAVVSSDSSASFYRLHRVTPPEDNNSHSGKNATSCRIYVPDGDLTFSSQDLSIWCIKK
jgi:hypothetical protein